MNSCPERQRASQRINSDRNRKLVDAQGKATACFRYVVASICADSLDQLPALATNHLDDAHRPIGRRTERCSQHHPSVFKTTKLQSWPPCVPDNFAGGQRKAHYARSLSISCPYGRRRISSISQRRCHRRHAYTRADRLGRTGMETRLKSTKKVKEISRKTSRRLSRMILRIYD